ncbi:general transcription factor IIH subunit 1-like [Sycon ciliatum]|uniref:general transcription factor IIH subunit 1-like n=1 Tax=Sycon ciliatum TaxID=27933 RepID=UPI0020A90DF2|eukprot:scpid50264/ scgid24847/ General transcription factor IIH subunit 1; Basic transcription factor 2 62 kDa subunit; General transcription factor IIH polypeptide 1; TFIIH basal transcription factor complex p62 subunit
MASVDWDPGEELLLENPRVRHKKKDGVLYLTNKRFAWTEYAASEFRVSHFYPAIRAQKISPETTAKIQMQIVLHDSTTNTFHFANDATATAARSERDSVKEMLVQLLAQNRAVPSKELEEKNRILQSHPAMHRLYKDLVGCKIMTPEEFWEFRLLQDSIDQSAQQSAGVSSAFLANLQPQIDGCNSVRYNLNPDTIAAIFKTYPAVKRKFQEFVPDKLSEVQFWTQFFQSQYFHRDRLGAGSAAKGKADMFSECAKQDEAAQLKSHLEAVQNPLIDLTKQPAQVEEGYGMSSTTKSSVLQPMMRRFNHQSLMILNSSSSAPAETSNTTAGSAAQSSSASSTAVEPAAKRSLVPSLRDTVILEDLAEGEQAKLPSLQIRDLGRFAEGPTIAPQIIQSTADATNTELSQADTGFRHTVAHLSSNLCQATRGEKMEEVFAQLSSGQWPGESTGHTSFALSDSLKEELHSHHLAVGELLRHFWSCFPVRTKQLEEKLVRMGSVLQAYRSNQLAMFQESLVHEDGELTSHIHEMIDAGLEKYRSWQARQTARRRT